MIGRRATRRLESDRGRRRGRVALFGLVLAAASLTARGEPERGFRGYLAICGERVVADENAERLFVPASVLKLVVSTAALHYLGPQHRVETVVRAAGGVTDGVLAGDLVVVAAGDPTWSGRFFRRDPRRPLRELARQIEAAGIRRVAGGLVVDASRFPGRSYPESRPLSELAYGYAAPTSALAVDESSVRVEIGPGPRVGAPGTARLLDRGGALRLVSQIRTVGRERHGRGTVDFQPQWDGSTLFVRGEYPLSEPPYRLEVSVPSGDLWAGEALRRALGERGIEIAGGVRTSPRPASPEAAVVARFTSPPVAQILEPILQDSSNWHAEMLLRLVAAEVSGEGRIESGLELERRFLEEEVGLAPDSFALDDASGLSPYNLLAPRAVVELLRYAWRQSWRGHLLAALAQPENGTLRVWSDLPPMAAKTGTLRQTVALAGYLEPGHSDPARRGPLVFASFLNHRVDERSRMRAEIAAQVRQWRFRARALPGCARIDQPR